MGNFGNTNRLIDLTGKKVGFLTVVERGRVLERGHLAWVCECICGNVKEIDGQLLRKERVQSCGCKRGELISKVKKKIPEQEKRLYSVWLGMKARCYQKSNQRYDCYGGRGIEVCEEWRKSYASFRDWAMANGYDPDAEFGACTIDRIDVNGNYEPANCRWASRSEQANNTRSNRYITLNGETHTITEWSRITGVHRRTIAHRLERGVDVETALFAPPRSCNE